MPRGSWDDDNDWRHAAAAPHAPQASPGAPREQRSARRWENNEHGLRRARASAPSATRHHELATSRCRSGCRSSGAIPRAQTDPALRARRTGTSASRRSGRSRTARCQIPRSRSSRRSRAGSAASCGRSGRPSSGPSQTSRTGLARRGRRRSTTAARRRHRFPKSAPPVPTTRWNTAQPLPTTLPESGCQPRLPDGSRSPSPL
jgi:hypothetical protein